MLFLSSFGVLLWECLTGEIPYKGFDQMQVAFGIATNKYSLPIPTTCPEEFSQLMKGLLRPPCSSPGLAESRLDCWQILPRDRPTFGHLYEQITQAIERNYSSRRDTSDIKSTDESYMSMQADWKKEIQNIFEELKTKEQVKSDQYLQAMEVIG